MGRPEVMECCPCCSCPRNPGILKLAECFQQVDFTCGCGTRQLVGSTVAKYNCPCAVLGPQYSLEVRVAMHKPAGVFNIWGSDGTCWELYSMFHHPQEFSSIPCAINQQPQALGRCLKGWYQPMLLQNSNEVLASDRQRRRILPDALKGQLAWLYLQCIFLNR